MQKAYQQFELAVARAPAEPREGAVNHVCAGDNRLYGIGKRQLQVVVRVYSDFLSEFVGYPHVFCHHVADLLAVKRTEAVHEIYRLRLALPEQFQTLVKLAFADGGNRHDVDGRLVPLVLGVFYHVERKRNLVDIGRDPHEIYGAFFFGENICFVVALFGVRHDRELNLALVVTDHAVYVVLVAEAPRAELVGGENLVAVFVADLHVVDAGVGAGVVDGANLPVGKPAGIHEPAVAYRAVEHF